ncbi:(d)CMP kinase [candidate division WOR-3 bacterium]|nr:(d)CMP kinase [candidate division WOR-3 bacterium]HHD83060.1 (d)CMP kinase [Bacteroidota bacterium]
MIVAIDGPSASGKSTTAIALSRELDFLYIDTGAMYRAYTLMAIRLKIPLENEMAVSALKGQVKIELVNRPEGMLVMLNGEDVSKEIRKDYISKSVSIVSSYKQVREKMVELQRKMGDNQAVICEGRDIGTVVFPNADLKIFMTADIKERARRRQRDLLKLNINKELDEIERDLAKRDHLDSSREISPLKRAENAVLIDTTFMTFKEQVNFIKELILAKNEGKF